MNERNNIGAFISYHNIIRPVEFTLFGLVFAPCMMMLFSLLFLISPPKILEASLSHYIGFAGEVLSITMLSVGIFIRKRLLENKDVQQGKTLYLAQIYLYVYCVLCGIMFFFVSMVTFNGMKLLPISIGTVALLTGITIVCTYAFIKKSIRNGKYFDKNNVNEKMIAFSTSTACIALCMLALHIMKRLLNGFGLIIICIILIEAVSALAFIYYLKLKYAKKYDLEEYLPVKPLPNAYTNWQ
ncbi:MAG: hypothetical protein IKE52_05220 [Mogibacterium sp.]|nr:hypothetical protein [Mogibacterium sp.]